MRRLFLLPALVPALLFVACTPVQGVTPVLYRATAGSVLATAARVCVTLTPNAAYRPFMVVETTADSVLCYAKPISATLALNTYDPVTLRISAVQSTPGLAVTGVTGSQNWGGTAITNQNALIAVFDGLDREFDRVK